MSIVDNHQWTGFLQDHPEAHLLQAAEWGELKEGFGWKAFRVIHQASGAQILFRRLPLGYHRLSSQRADREWLATAGRMSIDCAGSSAIFLKVEPTAGTNSARAARPFQWMAAPIQPQRTIEIDLSDAPEAWLARMKTKRYNISLAQRKGVEVRASEMSTSSTG